jgi:two-component system, chemotaxis family, sensor kinase CheA
MTGGVSNEARAFLAEASENLDQLERDLASLQRDPGDMELAGRIRKLFHSIRSNCGFLGFHITERLCVKAESVVNKLIDNELTVTGEVGSVLLEAVDSVKRLCRQIEESGAEDGVETYQLVTKLHALVEPE